jgi:catechol 2,3-dioxygenase-like lactoylglutathione lyase family enzyme
MGKGFTISRVGHVGIHVTDMDRSLAWYRDILGLTLTGRWPVGGGEMAFMRFDQEHHNMVLFTHPTKVTPENRNAGYNALQHIAFEMDSRDEWLKALHDLRQKGVKIERGPLIHGPEGGDGPGNLLGGSGSRSFYFNDPDGNSIELYTDMMKVPAGEQFPRQEYAVSGCSKVRAGSSSQRQWRSCEPHGFDGRLWKGLCGSASPNTMSNWLAPAIGTNLTGQPRAIPAAPVDFAPR